MQLSTMQLSMVEHSMVDLSTVQLSIVETSIVECSIVECSTSYALGTRRRNTIKRTLYHTKASMSRGEFSVTRNFIFDVMKPLSVVIKTLLKEPFCVRFVRNVG